MQPPVGAGVVVRDVEQLVHPGLPGDVDGIAPQRLAHGSVVVHLDDMEQVEPVPPDPPTAHPGAAQSGVQVGRYDRMHALVVLLTARPQPGVQRDPLHQFRILPPTSRARTRTTRKITWPPVRAARTWSLPAWPEAQALHAAVHGQD